MGKTALLGLYTWHMLNTGPSNVNKFFPHNASFFCFNSYYLLPLEFTLLTKIIKALFYHVVLLFFYFLCLSCFLFLSIFLPLYLSYYEVPPTLIGCWRFSKMDQPPFFLFPVNVCSLWHIHKICTLILSAPFFFGFFIPFSDFTPLLPDFRQDKSAIHNTKNHR